MSGEVARSGSRLPFSRARLQVAAGPASDGGPTLPSKARLFRVQVRILDWQAAGNQEPARRASEYRRRPAAPLGVRHLGGNLDPDIDHGAGVGDGSGRRALRVVPRSLTSGGHQLDTRRSSDTLPRPETSGLSRVFESSARCSPSGRPAARDVSEPRFRFFGEASRTPSFPDPDPIRMGCAGCYASGRAPRVPPTLRGGGPSSRGRRRRCTDAQILRARRGEGSESLQQSPQHRGTALAAVSKRMVPRHEWSR
jgi:hypothetical protein